MTLQSPSLQATPGHLIDLRRELHRHPCLSGSENETAALIERHFFPFRSDFVYRDLGGHGIAFEFTGSNPGKTLMFRADLDALPIPEEASLPWSSVNSGVSHKCGHDGHMAILAGLGERLSHDRPQNGRVILLFQAEEETGRGAARVLRDPRFETMKPDYVFGLHNIPGFPAGTILTRKGTFAAASKGMIITLRGKTAHAAQPETGISPSEALSALIHFANRDLTKEAVFNDFVLATVIHTSLGERAFGTSPGYAELMLTLRSFRDDDMQMLSRLMEEKTNAVAASERLQYSISYTEEFPATVNEGDGIDILRNTARENGLMIRDLKECFRWSEDFGHFLAMYPGAFFGLGAGEATSQLHNPDYDFPDEITETGINILYALYKQILHPEIHKN